MSIPPTGDVDKAQTPCLIRVFCRVGALHRPEDFMSSSLPPYVSIHTWPSCTLNELAMELTEASPQVLPSPPYGTRLVFQLVFPDLRRTNAVPHGPPRFGVKELGTVIIGSSAAQEQDSWEKTEAGKTLSDSRFVVGDYISCAVLPPLDDGSIAPASMARSDFSRLGPEGRGQNRMRGPEARGHFPTHREDGRDGRGGYRDGGPDPGGFPTGEWRRGEQLPQGRPRGRGRGRGGRW